MKYVMKVRRSTAAPEVKITYLIHPDKKNPRTNEIDPGIPCFPRIARHPFHGIPFKQNWSQAGFLTPGSSCIHAFPGFPSGKKCEFRPRLQRRARPRISRGSLLSFLSILNLNRQVKAPENGSRFNKNLWVKSTAFSWSLLLWIFRSMVTGNYSQG